TAAVVSLDGQFTSVNYGSCSNSADAITLTLSAPAPTALVNGLTVQCKVNTPNTTTTPTLFVNSLGAPHTIVKAGNSGQAALVANDIMANMIATFRYDAGTTTWELQNPQQQPASGIQTINSNGGANQTIAGAGPITIVDAGSTHTVHCDTCQTSPTATTVG